MTMKAKYLGPDEGVLPGYGLVQPGDSVELPDDAVVGEETWKVTKKAASAATTGTDVPQEAAT